MLVGLARVHIKFESRPHRAEKIGIGIFPAEGLNLKILLVRKLRSYSGGFFFLLSFFLTFSLSLSLLNPSRSSLFSKVIPYIYSVLRSNQTSVAYDPLRCIPMRYLHHQWTRSQGWWMMCSTVTRIWGVRLVWITIKANTRKMFTVGLVKYRRCKHSGSGFK